ncbi:sucrase ferredoxin, partial [Deinococcus pimensis]|uniref:sucrase ferredoxin n=1 Tax=Deinococcus pimensis TaxID=309888 RepID=UPI0005EAD821
MTQDRALDLCAHDSRRSGEDPIGSAGRWDHAFRVELSLAAWDRFRDPDAWSPRRRDLMTRVAERTKATGVGHGLLLTATDEAGDRVRRVTHYARPARRFAAYVRTDHDTDEDGLLDLMEDALLGDRVLPEDAPAPPDATLDLHVCTHGRVDAACGKLGYPLFSELRDRLPEADVWRNGHFGGHRFAPTLVELPAGRAWGHLTPDVATGIARRTLA